MVMNEGSAARSTLLLREGVGESAPRRLTPQVSVVGQAWRSCLWHGNLRKPGDPYLSRSYKHEGDGDLDRGGLWPRRPWPIPFPA